MASHWPNHGSIPHVHGIQKYSITQNVYFYTNVPKSGTNSWGLVVEVKVWDDDLKCLWYRCGQSLKQFSMSVSTCVLMVKWGGQKGRTSPTIGTVLVHQLCCLSLPPTWTGFDSLHRIHRAAESVLEEE